MIRKWRSEGQPQLTMEAQSGKERVELLSEKLQIELQSTD